MVWLPRPTLQIQLRDFQYCLGGHLQDYGGSQSMVLELRKRAVSLLLEVGFFGREGAVHSWADTTVGKNQQGG